jgi:hypothetical protein
MIPTLAMLAMIMIGMIFCGRVNWARALKVEE